MTALATRRALGTGAVLLAGVLALAWAWRAPGLAPAAAPPAEPAERAGEAAPPTQLLQRQVREHPRDGRAWALLGYAELEAARYPEAAAAFERAVEASPKVALDPAVWCAWADALGMAQGGSLDGRPSELIAQALKLQPAHPQALEMAGSAAYGRRDFRAALQYWQRLLPQLQAGTQPHEELTRAIARTERLAATSLR
ncbi:MAG TPA: hypothetical protein VFQ16_04070 [Burkholderiaceae bacterium]|nr:hypothetical protein [Burkholderiaceae bacterium]